MYRGLIIGAFAFAAAILVEKQCVAVSKDIERYDRIRAMSGDPPLLKQGLMMLRDTIGSFGSAQRGEAIGLLESLQHDVVRYARISSM
jgi:hypothetical protein